MATLPVRALDGGVGRSLSGAQISPYEAIVPPSPGFYGSIGEIYYPGAEGGTRTFAKGGQLVTNLDLDISFTPITFAYNWPDTKEQWNLQSAVSLFYAYEKVNADVVANGVTHRRSDSASGIYDLYIRTIQGSYHISQTAHFGAFFDVWAPIGSYDSKDLANLSLDNWTFIPGISYTQIFPEENIEFSALWAVEFYSPNHDTNYQNGTMSRVETLVIKRFPSGLGIGAVGSWMQQLSDDTGPVAAVLDGFRGRVFGLGAILTYTLKVKQTDLSLNARWVHDIDAKNLTEGDVFSLSLGMKF